MSATFLTDVEGVALLGYSIVPGTTISSDTTTDGTAVDCLTADGPVTVFFCTGNAGDADTTIQFKVIECDTSSGSYSVVSDGSNDALAASATANDNLVVAITAAKRSKRYVKARVVTAGGGTPSVPVTAFVMSRKKISGSGTGTLTT